MEYAWQVSTIKKISLYLQGTQNNKLSIILLINFYELFYNTDEKLLSGPVHPLHLQTSLYCTLTG